MKRGLKWIAVAVLIALATCWWVLHFHNPGVASALPKWSWLQWSIGAFAGGESLEAAEDEDPDNTKNAIPVHVTRPTLSTLHRYVEGFGTVSPHPAQSGQAAGVANLSSPVAGVIAEVMCRVGQTVRAGDPVVRLDDRLAKSAEAQAIAALAQAEASLAALKAMPRPDQLEIAQLSVEKYRSAVRFAERNNERLAKLAVDQGTSSKNVEQSAQELSSAKSDLAVSEKQLTALKALPVPEDLRQEEAKVNQAAAVLATARTQRQMMTISSPIDATVVSLLANPGESADPTRQLVQLVSLDRLVVAVDIPAEQLPLNAEGLPAEVFPPLTPAVSSRLAPPTGSAENEPIIGKVSAVSPQVDIKTGAVTVYVDLPKESHLRPGLAVRVRIVAELHKDCLVVPRDAVVADENGDSVVSVVVGDQATHKAVQVGLEEEGAVEISADGITESSVIVTGGAFGLPAATRVKVLE